MIHFLFFLSVAENKMMVSAVRDTAESSNLGEEEVELLARAVVAPLGQEEFDLFPNLLLVEMPAVLVVHAGSRRGVRGS